jgi:hypothetical protein
MSKSNNKSSRLQKTRAGRSAGNNSRQPTSIKSDLILFGIMIIIISGITGGYFFYSNYNSDDSGPANQNLIDNQGNNNGGIRPNDGHGNEPLPDDSTPDNSGNSNSGTRTVLLETFTSTECYWCNTEEEPALKQLAQDYSRDELLIVAYHGFYGNDPFETAEGNQRADYYGGISGTPTLYADGVLKKVGGTGKGVNAMYDVYEDFYKQRSVVSTPLALSITADRTGSNVQVNADVSSTSDLVTSTLAVRFALLEDGLSDSGKTFDWVVRSLWVKSMAGTSLPNSYQHIFSINEKWITSNLGVVVWIQDNGNKEVLQSSFINIE